MSASVVALVVFVLMLAGSALGAFLRSILPRHHLSDDSKEMVFVCIAFLSTLAALVLGLLLSTAKSSFDAKADEVRAAAAKLILLDTSLRQYGTDAAALRQLLRQTVRARISLTWIEGEADAGAPTATRHDMLEELQDRLLALAPANDAQRLSRERAVRLSDELANLHWLLVAQTGSSIPLPFLAVLLLWLVTITASMGLYAPRHGTLLALQVLCAASVAGAIFLIIEMDQPFTGFLRIPDAPLREVIDQIGR